MSDIDPAAGAVRLANLGFLANPDVAHRPEGAYLLVALRAIPSLHHYDPELVEYWTTVDGRGQPQRLTRDSRLPCRREFSWGPVRILDRLGIANEYLAFGGVLVADQVDDVAVAVFTSPAPLLKGGGHSQDWDLGGASVGAYFGRLLLAVDIVPGFERRMALATPLARYAAFVTDESGRYESSPPLRAASSDVWAWLEAERHWLQSTSADDWAAGAQLRPEATIAASAGRSLARTPRDPQRSPG